MKFRSPLLLAICAYQCVGADAPARREYRAHAYVRVLGIPIFSRQDVGGGYASVAESEGVKTLIFAGGSLPDRTRGLNRVGLIEETIRKRPDQPEEFSYFGFVVTSSEANFEQASKALKTKPGETITYSVAAGKSAGADFQCTVTRLQVPSGYTWAKLDELRRDIATKFEAASDVKRNSVPVDSARTFLDSIHLAILDSGNKSSRPVVYNGKRFLLTTEKQEDARMHRELVSRKVIRDSTHLIRINGLLTEWVTHEKTPFELWIDKDDVTGLPVRIEYNAKSYLKLVFEARGR